MRFFDPVKFVYGIVLISCLLKGTIYKTDFGKYWARVNALKGGLQKLIAII